jgi:hypothetical protein
MKIKVPVTQFKQDRAGESIGVRHYLPLALSKVA